MDPLGEALHFLRMSGTSYSRSELTAPWGLLLPPVHDGARFHVVASGQCWLEVDGMERMLLEPGDMALVPRGERHCIADAPATPALPLDQLPIEHLENRYAVIRHGGGGVPTRLVCGSVRFDHPSARYLIELLPRVIHIARKESRSADWLPDLMRFIASEVEQQRPGGETIITRLADILVIQAIRTWIERVPGSEAGWLGALRDPQIGRAIAAIHRSPANAWTVATLANQAAMSRSAFSARFALLVGEAPMHYLARWRMQLAQTWLGEVDEALVSVAGRVGYQSESAFNRAFKRHVGVPPGAMRRRRRDVLTCS